MQASSASMKLIVITDLDGTLVDESRPVEVGFTPAMPALEKLKERGCPLVLCSSKTRAEMEWYRTQMGNEHPFVAENGGGVFVPRGYFRGLESGALPGVIPEPVGEYFLFRLGAAYTELRQVMAELRAKGIPVRGFGDMTCTEIAELTGLDPEAAALAKQREFDEPFVIDPPGADMAELLELVTRRGLCVTRARFHHLMGASDKGAAVRLLVGLYRRESATVLTIGIGNHVNDLPMLHEVDYPVFVGEPQLLDDRCRRNPNLIVSSAPGPVGWNQAVLTLLEKLG